MTQFDPDSDAVEDDTPDPADPANLRRQLRDALKSNKELRDEVAEGQTIRKENAFLKAGLPDTPMANFYRDHYAGDIDDAAIKAGAIDLGIIPPLDAATQAEVAGIAGQSQALVGSVPSMAPNDRDAILKEFGDVVSRGGDGEAVLRKYGIPTASDSR